jgi:branched-chain amino acid transport system permease protein
MKVLLVSGLVLGLLYSVQALAFVLVIRGTGVLNFAQGQILALGAYGYLALNGRVGGSFLTALLGMLALAGVVGVVVYDGIVRHLARAPLWTVVIALFALGLVLDSLIQIFWGSEPRFMEPPIQPRPVHLPGGLTADTLDLLVSAIAVACIAAVVLATYLTPLGRRMRASADNQALAMHAGIDTRRIGRISWALGSMMAALAGLMVAVRTTVSPALTLAFLTAFPAVLIGGFESIGGAVVGAFLLAYALQAGVTYLGGAVALPLAYALLFAMLLVRPHGLFGARDIVRI